MAERKFISYLRVSTDKQGKSGLGIEAQRQAVERYLNGGRWTVAAEYVETESGRRSDRAKLAAALAHAKAIKAKLVFAKLDRLTRNVDLLRSLVASDVDLVFCDLPNVPPGPMGRFLLTQMAAVAELEAGLISERTKNALARRLVHHQAADEVHITAQAVELRYDYGSLVLLGQLHRCGQLGPLFQRIGAFAGLDLAEDLDQIVALGLGEGGNRRLLGV